MLHLLRSLTPNQRGAIIASYLGWTLDAFDFFILVFVLKDVAQEFATDVITVSVAITLTLAPVNSLAGAPVRLLAAATLGKTRLIDNIGL